MGERNVVAEGCGALRGDDLWGAMANSARRGRADWRDGVTGRSLNYEDYEDEEEGERIDEEQEDVKQDVDLQKEGESLSSVVLRVAVS